MIVLPWSVSSEVHRPFDYGDKIMLLSGLHAALHISTALEQPASGSIHSNQANNAFDGKHKCSSIIRKIGATCTDSDAYDKQTRATGTLIEHEHAIPRG